MAVDSIPACPGPWTCAGRAPNPYPRRKPSPAAGPRMWTGWCGAWAFGPTVTAPIQSSWETWLP